jgi:hypothetical protein
VVFENQKVLYETGGKIVVCITVGGSGETNSATNMDRGS